MSRIGACFSSLRAKDRRGLVAYLTCGDPHLDETIDLVREAEDAGADIIELGVPWSDPSADGPTIQRAMERALAGGTTLARTLETIAALRRVSQIPLVLFGYYNPILARGVERVAREAAAAGVDGVLTVDLPLEEAAELDVPLAAQGIDRIPLLTPTTDAARAARQAARGSGFAYYVSLTGVTGAGHLDVAEVGRALERLRPALGALPLAVGFGVKDAATARALGQHADAVVVGSALVEAIAGGKDPADRRRALRAKVSELAAALR